MSMMCVLHFFFTVGGKEGGGKGSGSKNRIAPVCFEQKERKKREKKPVLWKPR